MSCSKKSLNAPASKCDTQASKENLKLEVNLQKLLDENQKIREKLKNIELENKHLSIHMQTIEVELHVKRSALHSLTAEIKTNKRLLAERYAERYRLQSELQQNCSSATSADMGDYAELLERNQWLQAQLTERNERIETLENQMSACHSHMQNLDNVLARSKQNNSALKVSLGEQTQLCERQLQNIQALNAEIKSLHQHSQALQKNLMQLHKEHAEVNKMEKDKLETITVELDCTRQQLDVQIERNETLSKDFSKLKEQNMQMLKLIDEFRTTLTPRDKLKCMPDFNGISFPQLHEKCPCYAMSPAGAVHSACCVCDCLYCSNQRGNWH